MTTVACALGRPRAAASRRGDCHALDLGQDDRLIIGPHRFAATTHCRIDNGLLSVTVGASGAAPTLTIEGHRPATTTGDVFVDTFHDVFGGTHTPREWLDLGTLTIDSPSVSALLTAVRLVDINPEAVTIRLVAPLMADAFVTLRRGERMVHVQHGDTRSPVADVDRRVRLTDSPSPVGTAAIGRVQEGAAAHQGFPRWIGAIDPVTANAGAFSLTAASVTTARFGAGAGTYSVGDTPGSSHAQLGNSSRPGMVT
jgi:hypothetical protein